jgi:hypothetical protein
MEVEPILDKLQKKCIVTPSYLNLADKDIIVYIRSIIVSSMDLIVGNLLNDIIAFVQSIMALDLSPICPKFWHHAMKDPAHKSCWIKAMFKHLNSCYAIGTFGPPRIPPQPMSQSYQQSLS